MSQDEVYVARVCKVLKGRVLVLVIGALIRPLSGAYVGTTKSKVNAEPNLTAPTYEESIYLDQ